MEAESAAEHRRVAFAVAAGALWKRTGLDFGVGSRVSRLVQGPMFDLDNFEKNKIILRRWKGS